LQEVLLVGLDVGARVEEHVEAPGIARRLTPGSFLSRTIATSMSAPVLPQETQTCASPARTDSIADHIEVSCPWRMTWLGLSSMRTTPAASRTSQRAVSPAFAISRSSSGFGPWTMKWRSGFFSADSAMPATTAVGPRSPPIASMETTMRLCA
jgi:hypothetical protein